MHVFPDLSTLRPAPWAAGTAFCLMDAVLARGGAEHPLDSRSILRRSVMSLEDLGYEAWVAPELEFYLCDRDWRPAFDDHRCWSMTRGAEYEPVIGEIRAMLLAAGVPIESSQTEGGPAQFEINVGPASPIETADNAAVLKYVVKLITERHDLRATFMPMPFTGMEGSGHHIHNSLRRKGSTERVRDRRVGHARVPRRRSDAHGRYDRHQPPNGQRLQATEGLHVRAESRVVGPRQPDRGCADPARRARGATAREPNALGRCQPLPHPRGRHRLRSRWHRPRLQPPPEIEGDAYKDDSLERIPGTLAAAIDIFEQSAFCKDVFGELFVETYSILGRREEAAFREHVTDWERDRYLEPS